MRRLCVVRPNITPWEEQVYRNSEGFNVRFVGSRESKKPVSNVEIIPAQLSCYFPYPTQALENALKGADVINSLEVYSYLSSQCARLAPNSKLTITVWETIFPHSIYNFTLPYFLNLLKVKRSGHLFLPMTEKSAQYLYKQGIPKERVQIVYPGTNLDKFKPAKRDHDKLRILFIGRLVKQKGVCNLLRAFEALSKIFSDLELYVLGRGPLENYVKEYSKKFPVKFFGFIEHDDLPRFYQECDIFCFPSFDYFFGGFKIWEEQFGYVAIEAMASGLPVVGSTCGAIPEVLGEKNLIVPQNSVKELYIALKRLIQDDELRSYLKRSNRERCEKMFDAKKQGEALGKVFNNILT